MSSHIPRNLTADYPKSQENEQPTNTLLHRPQENPSHTQSSSPILVDGSARQQGLLTGEVATNIQGNVRHREPDEKPEGPPAKTPRFTITLPTPVPSTNFLDNKKKYSLPPEIMVPLNDGIAGTVEQSSLTFQPEDQAPLFGSHNTPHTPLHQNPVSETLKPPEQATETLPTSDTPEIGGHAQQISTEVDEIQPQPTTHETTAEAPTLDPDRAQALQEFKDNIGEKLKKYKYSTVSDKKQCDVYEYAERIISIKGLPLQLDKSSLVEVMTKIVTANEAGTLKEIYTAYSYLKGMYPRIQPAWLLHIANHSGGKKNLEYIQKNWAQLIRLEPAIRPKELLNIANQKGGSKNLKYIKENWAELMQRIPNICPRKIAVTATVIGSSKALAHLKEHWVELLKFSNNEGEKLDIDQLALILGKQQSGVMRLNVLLHNDAIKSHSIKSIIGILSSVDRTKDFKAKHPNRQPST